jgi:hypothetical protein
MLWTMFINISDLFGVEVLRQYVNAGAAAKSI